MVRQHLHDPEKCWDEAFRLKDGGITLLAESLAPVCRPELKRDQLRARLGELRAEMRLALGEYHVSDDAEEERQKRLVAARKSLAELRNTISAQRFGHLLGALQLNNEELQSLFRRLSAKGEVSAGARPDVDDIFEVAGIHVDGVSIDAPAAQKAVRDKYMDLAEAAIALWTERLQQLSQQDKLMGFLKTKAEPIELIVRELLSGAEKANLTLAIADEMRKVAPPIGTASMSMLSEAMAATERIDRYIWKLNQDMTSAEKRVRVASGTRMAFGERSPVVGIVELPVRPTAFYQVFISDWLATFMALVNDNTKGGTPGKFSPQEAATLQKIMTALA